MKISIGAKLIWIVLGIVVVPVMENTSQLCCTTSVYRGICDRFWTLSIINEI